MPSQTLAAIRPQSIVAPLDAIERAAAEISTLSELRGLLEEAQHNEGSEFVRWFTPGHAGAIAAGIEALAASIDEHLDQINQAAGIDAASRIAAPAVRPW
jgi:hypothetical protein